MDYFRNELTDKLYLRYLESFELTNETVDTTGKDAYKFIQDTYTKNLRSDLKIIDDCVKHYNIYKNKEFKHLIKLEKIGFEELTEEEFKELSFIKRFCYKNKKSKAAAEDKKLIKLERKYRKWICLAESDVTEEETIEEVAEESIKNEDVKKTENSIEVIKNYSIDEATKLLSSPRPKTAIEVLNRIVSGEVKEDNIACMGASELVEEQDKKESEGKAGDTVLSAKEEIKKNGGISLSEGTQITLEAFFNTSNEEGKT